MRPREFRTIHRCRENGTRSYEKTCPSLPCAPANSDGYMHMTDDNLVFQSYGRCCKSPAFFDDFYTTFLASSPEVSEKFIDTDLSAQKHLLRAGILNLVLYARGLPPTKLQALAESHSRGKLDIKPHLYNYWLEALLITIRKHDAEMDQSGLEAWRRVLNKGIEVIKGGY